MKRSLLQQLILYEYRYAIGYMVLVALAFYAMFWRLGTLVPGLNEIEIQQATLSTNLGNLVTNPLDPLFRILQWGSFQVIPDPLVAARLPSALFGLGSIMMMYLVVTLKFTKRIGIVTSIIFAISSWFLPFARFSHPAIATVFLILALIYTSYRANETRKLKWIVALMTVVGIGIYHRWFIYFLIIGVLVSFNVIKDHRHLIKRKAKLAALMIGLLFIFPLAWSMTNDPLLLKTLLNLPADLPGLSTIFNNAQSAVSYVFWRSDSYPLLHLGTLPMLDIFSASMVALGLYHLDHEISKTLSRYVLICFGFCFLLVTINPNPFIFALFLPFTYILIAAGFIMLTSQWNEIFPKNPIARMIAFIPLTFLVMTVVAYHNERYFLAWPRTPEVTIQYPESIGRLNAFIKGLDHDVVVIGTPEQASTYEIMTRTYDQVQFLAYNSDIQVLSAKTTLVTPEAEAKLPKTIREKLPSNVKPLSSSSSLEPTLFYVYTVSE